jgi:membrane carboxypeptidase/penicillin-binding protein PbpC
VRGGIRLRWTLLVFGLLVAVLGSGVVLWVASLGPAPLGQDLQFSKVVLDRNGALLRP